MRQVGWWCVKEGFLYWRRINNPRAEGDDRKTPPHGECDVPVYVGVNDAPQDD